MCMTLALPECKDAPRLHSSYGDHDHNVVQRPPHGGVNAYDQGPDSGRAPRFYCLRGDKLYAGNSSRVFENTSPYNEVTGDLGDELRELFRGYQSELKSNAGQPADDPDAREGLSALGYTE